MAQKTNQDLDKLGKMITEELRWAGMIGDNQEMHVQKGSKTNGVAYRLWTYNMTNGGTSNKPLSLNSDAWLGNTRSEAYQALLFILRTLEAVRAHKG